VVLLSVKESDDRPPDLKLRGDATATDPDQSERQNAREALNATLHPAHRGQGDDDGEHRPGEPDNARDAPILDLDSRHARLVDCCDENPGAEAETERDAKSGVAQCASPLRRPETAQAVRLEITWRDAKRAQQRLMRVHGCILACRVYTSSAAMPLERIWPVAWR
jgi:hypothetical protein